jgi:hypothetical protein
MAEAFKPISATAVNVMARLAPDVPNIPRYPAVAHALAYHLARRAVERQVQAEGKRRPWAEIIARAQAYSDEHREELLAQAAEIVRTNPRWRPWIEREEREQARQRRKRTRACVVENPCRSVRSTDNANSATDNAEVFSTTFAIFRAWCLLITY